MCQFFSCLGSLVYLRRTQENVFSQFRRLAFINLRNIRKQEVNSIYSKSLTICSVLKIGGKFKHNFSHFKKVPKKRKRIENYLNVILFILAFSNPAENTYLVEIEWILKIIFKTNSDQNQIRTA